MMNVETISERLVGLGDAIRYARDTVAADDDAPEALKRSVQDLARQHREMKLRARHADPRVARELVHLLQAVADRARNEAHEVHGLEESTRYAVVAAHDAIAALAVEVESPTWSA